MANGERKTILLVDDEVESLDYLKNILLRQDYDVISTDKGADAITKAKLYLPDLIILDVMLPDIQGDEVIARLREHQPTQDIPVIIISGVVLQKGDETRNTMRAPKQYVLAKPITPDEITTLVKKVI